MSQLKIENVIVTGWIVAIRGMRFPMNSEAQSDSIEENNIIVLGEKDLKLMQKLARAGTDHSKFLRMIHVQIEITAPLYWWKQADQYKVSTTTNSTSTMHKIMEQEFTLDNFAHDKLTFTGREKLRDLIDYLNILRTLYKDYDTLKDTPMLSTWDTRLVKEVYESKEVIWNELIQLLPSSYMQKRAWDFSYQTLINMIKARKNHKLDEWHDFCNIMLKECPYLAEIIGEEI